MTVKVGPIYDKNWNASKKITVNRGGTRSGKTYSIMQLIANWLVTGQIRNGGYEYVDPITKVKEWRKVDETGIFQVVRQFRSTLTASVMRDWDEIIDSFGIRGELEVSKKDLTYKYKTDKGYRVVEFFGADDEQKLRGVKRLHLYCNEANELSYHKEFFQLQMRTDGLIFIDFNPDDEGIWINTELEKKRQFKEKDVEVIVSSYKDNPFLSASLVMEIERMEEDNPLFWEIFGCGEYGQMRGRIFDKFDTIEAVPRDAKFIGYGMDFGYTNDPTACVAAYEDKGNYYFDEIFYEKGLLNTNIIELLKDRGVHTTDNIIGDSSEPKTIAEIKKAGFHITGAKKGKDSIKFGLDIMMQKNIVLTERSFNLRREISRYVWKVSSDGITVFNEPAERQEDHAIDAVRYIISDKKKKGGRRNFLNFSSFTEDYGTAY